MEEANNNSVHSNTGFTPFKVVLGQDFVAIPKLPLEKPQTPSLMEWIQQLQNSWPVAHRTLEAVQEAFKWQAKKMCAKQKEFKVGNRVYRSTKYIQSTQQSRNLGPKHMGPSAKL